MPAGIKYKAATFTKKEAGLDLEKHSMVALSKVYDSCHVSDSYPICSCNVYCFASVIDHKLSVVVGLRNIICGCVAPVVFIPKGLFKCSQM